MDQPKRRPSETDCPLQFYWSWNQHSKDSGSWMALAHTQVNSHFEEPSSPTPTQNDYQTIALTVIKCLERLVMTQIKYSHQNAWRNTRSTDGVFHQWFTQPLPKWTAGTLVSACSSLPPVTPSSSEQILWCMKNGITMKFPWIYDFRLVMITYCTCHSHQVGGRVGDSHYVSGFTVIISIVFSSDVCDGKTLSRS